MLALSNRINTYKKFAQWFADLEENMDNYRNTISRKLDDFHMNIQRPKVAMNGPPQLAYNALGSYAEGINTSLRNQKNNFAEHFADHGAMPHVDFEAEGDENKDLAEEVEDLNTGDQSGKEAKKEKLEGEESDNK